MGLKRDLITAKQIAWKSPIVTPEMEKEAELTRDAIVKFLTDPRLHFTITELKASVELEKFETTDGLKASIIPDTLIADKKPILDAFQRVLDLIGGLGGEIISKLIKAIKKQAEPLTEDCTYTKPLELKRDGSPQGGYLKANGHAYVGLKDPVPNSDTTERENEFTKVQLIKNKIPKDLL